MPCLWQYVQCGLQGSHMAQTEDGHTLSCRVWLQGDSGFMLVREGKVVYRSPVLQHFFDCPLQFGAVPDFSESTDSAEDAAVAELQVQPGDVLLAGSDGLWDNCYDAELLQLLPERPEGAQQVLAWQGASCRAVLSGAVTGQGSFWTCAWMQCLV